MVGKRFVGQAALALGMTTAALSGTAGAETIDNSHITRVEQVTFAATPNSPAANEAGIMKAEERLLTGYEHVRNYASGERNSISVGCAATGNGVVEVIYSPVVETNGALKANFGGNYLSVIFKENDGHTATYDIVKGAPEHVIATFDGVETGDEATVLYSLANGASMETETVSLDKCAKPTPTTTTTQPTPTTTPTSTTRPGPIETYSTTPIITSEVSVPTETKTTLPETGANSVASFEFGAAMVAAGLIAAFAGKLKHRNNSRYAK